MQTYRLIAIDLDGTLARNDKTISNRNIEKLLEAQRSGVKVAITSGRPEHGIEPIADMLQLEKFGGYVIAYNGAKIINWQTKEVLHSIQLPHDVLPTIYKAAKESRLTMLTYNAAGDAIVSENIEDKYVKRISVTNKMGLKAVDNLLETITYPIPKTQIVGDEDVLMDVEKLLASVLKGKVEVYRSEPYYLEFAPLHVNKATGLAALLKKTGVKRSELIAFGDGYNDQCMIEFAGLGIAMANAQEPVKEVADFITLSNEEDGVAYGIERFV